jgi:hypothetical protein
VDSRANVAMVNPDLDDRGGILGLDGAGAD